MFSIFSFKLTKPLDRLMCNLKRSGAFTERHYFVNVTVLFTHFPTKARNHPIKAWLTELPSHSIFLVRKRNFRASSHTIFCMLKRNCGFIRLCEVLRPSQHYGHVAPVSYPLTPLLGRVRPSKLLLSEHAASSN